VDVAHDPHASHAAAEPAAAPSDSGAPGPERRFSAAVAAVTSAFGDPTRREIYLHVRSHPGATASEVAATFSLHPNVARHHLDRLAAGGYLEVTLERPADGGAGRPSKHYRAAEGPGADPTVELAGRRDELLVSLLAEALALLGPDEAERMAERVGEEYGRVLAERMEPGEGQRSLRAAMHAIADALTAHGFAAHAEDRGSSTAVVAEHCPFGEAASAHPVICAVDRGMVRGLLSGLCGMGDTIPVVLSSRARGDDACAALV
jgi:predicted ArsR family transcriptional regulator